MLLACFHLWSPPKGGKKRHPKNLKIWTSKTCVFTRVYLLFELFHAFVGPQNVQKAHKPNAFGLFWTPKKGSQNEAQKRPPKGTPKVTKMKPKMVPKSDKKGCNIVSFCCWLSPSLFFSSSLSFVLSLSLLSLSSFFSLSAAAAAAAASVFLVLSLSFSFSFFSLALSCLALGKVSFLKRASRSC